MKPSEVKNISKLMEKRNRISEDLTMFLATSQVGVLHMLYPKTFESIYDAELWKEQCNKLFDNITAKTTDLKQYLNDEIGDQTNKNNRPSLSLRLISRHYTDDDMDHLNPGYLKNSPSKDSAIKNTETSVSDNEDIVGNINLEMNGNLSQTSVNPIEDEEQSLIASQSEMSPQNMDLLLQEMQNISDISDNDLELSDITLGSESDEKPEYVNNRKRKKRVKKPECVQNSVKMKRFKRPCHVNLIRFDTKLFNEFIAKNNIYKLKELTDFLRLTKKRKRSPSLSSCDSLSSCESSLASYSPAYYPDREDSPYNSADNNTDEPLHTIYQQKPMNSEDEMIAAMNQISDSDISGCDSDSDSDSNAKNKNDKLKKKNKKKNQKDESDLDSDLEPENMEQSSSAWKRDPLLRGNLDREEKLIERKRNDSVKVEDDIEEDDIEEIEENKRKTREMTPDSEKDYDYIPVVDDCSTDTVDSDIECLGNVSISPGKGRRNIRPLLHDEALQEATQRANKIEQEKQKRLEELKNSVSSFVLSQSSNSELEGLLLDVDQVSMKPIVVVNAHLSNRLKAHQQEGVKFMWNACFEKVERMSQNEGSGCVLAHCMGLGKTFQVTTLVHTLFAHPDTKVKHVLIICPLSTVPNWKHEFVLTKKIAKGGVFKIFHKCNSTSNIRMVVHSWRKQGGVFILGYDAFLSLVTRKETKSYISKSTFAALEEALRNPGPDLLVCDEGHLLKNQNKKKYKAIDLVKTRRRIILTGTPMQNNLTEYYYMVQLIKPNLLGTFKEFTNRFNNPITNGQYGDSTNADIKIMKQRSHVLHEILRGTVQRYEESELNMYLPPKVDYALYIQMNEVQASLYRDVLNKLRSDRDPGKKGSEFISHYQQLMPFCMHPCIPFSKERKKPVEYETITIDNQEETVIDLTPDLEDKFPADVESNINYGAKFVVIMAIIEECIRVGDRLLIFSTNLFMLDTIEKFLKLSNEKYPFNWIKNKTYFRLDGQVHPIDRVGITDKFNDLNSDAKLMLMTNRVGGLGLNLVAANRVILTNISWNPALDTQSVFRSYRFGQEKPVYIYRLIARGTMEETVYRRAVTKVAIAGRVVDEQQIDRHYKFVDLQELYRFDYNKDEVRQIPKVPTDNLLATLLQMFPAHIFGYDEHNSLFLNRPDEELNEEEMKEAWIEFNKEKAPKPPPQMVTNTVNAGTDILWTRFLDEFLPKSMTEVPLHYLTTYNKNTINASTPDVIKSPAIVSQASKLPSRFSLANIATNMVNVLSLSPNGKTNKDSANVSQEQWLNRQMASILPTLPLNLLRNHKTDGVLTPKSIRKNSSVTRSDVILPACNEPITMSNIYRSNNNEENTADENASAKQKEVTEIDLTVDISTDKRPAPEPTEQVSAPEHTAPAEPETFIVNPFLPTENIENNQKSNGDCNT